MSASKEDLRVSIETMSDWSRIKANYAQAARTSLAKELIARNLSESSALSQHLDQFMQNTFQLVQPNLRVNGQSFDERSEDNIEPFDESLDRHVWSLHDQRLGLQKTIAVTRRVEPSKIEKTMSGSLEQYHKLDALESELEDLPEDLSMDVDDTAAFRPEVDALLRTAAWAQELSQSIPNQTERTTRLKNVTAELKRPDWR
ncbi:hypothetical protein GGU11DRAFT_343818 [Lentinula aff. detonsa]|uniref:Uncharacterized protein n=1 Tax=Lentinula aff. detonsa TaxID=2804958 RepID=A0AA38L720_9AGAR|nr:hypothetical protein GGU10DRAFT_345369 [Lentinula aff. detonsa]KAJ3794091.1 hypothetical protein GGU11DRAFT_343818 [Lentinula aff. detonsa]